MPGKNKECNRSVAEWVTWAKAEGFSDISEEGPEGKTFPGKVYCTLCAMSFVANSKTIKQHCLGYKVVKDGSTTFIESKHALKIKKRQPVDAPVAQAAPAVPQPIVIQVSFALHQAAIFLLSGAHHDKG